MAQFADTEEQLLGHITEDRLRGSLVLIRQAMEDIWANDAPRIIQDYTDHGEKHSVRLARFAAELLEANSGRPLSSHEMYLLLAGIYWHDIGMQCDILRFPQISKRAEELGAQFEVEFTAPVASQYSVDEQKTIRKNHQYLTAAWIDYAYRTGETAVGAASKTIPADLVNDLMDVCKYHARLPITDCPLAFQLDQTGRKQLVAALLRFADELDVDGHRVSIETVKNFRLDPRNSVYWWLHNCTKVVFTARNVIALSIRLHPDDARQYGSIVYSAFIAEFQKKNWPVLSTLAQNSIPIVISADSKVLEHDRTEPLPPDIVKALQSIAPVPTAERASRLVSSETTQTQISYTLDNLLLIEDDDNWQDTLSRLLEGAGYKIEVVPEYSRALQRILEASVRPSASDVALCVTDLRLADSAVVDNLNGLGLLAVCQIREIPTIVVSGYLRGLRDELHDKFGVMAYFDKLRFYEQQQEFLAAVQRTLASRKCHRDHATFTIRETGELGFRAKLQYLIHWVIENYTKAHAMINEKQIRRRIAHGKASAEDEALWLQQLNELDQKYDALIKKLSQVSTTDGLDRVHLEIVRECLEWAAGDTLDTAISPT